MDDDVNKTTSKKSSTDNGVLLSEQSRPALDKKKLKERAGKTWQGMWKAVGALATMGGAIGLFQILTAEPNSSIDQTNTLLLAMVAEGVISDEQAKNLASALAGTSNALGSEGSETVKTAVLENDKDALIAMAKMFDKDTREEGINALEASAETAKDWLVIAQVSIGTDNVRSLRAVEKSVKLDNEDFQAITLLVQLQAVVGEYDQARRSAESARMLARTPKERMMAEQAALSISMAGYDKDLIASDLVRLESAIKAYQPIVDAVRFQEVVAKNNIDDHPYWAMAFMKQRQTGAEVLLERLEDARITAKASIDLYKGLEPHVDVDILPAIKKRQITMLRTIAYTYTTEEDFDTAKTYEEKIVSIYEGLVEEGDANAPVWLASAWRSVGNSSSQSDDWDEAVKAYEISLKMLKDLSEKSPDSEELRKNTESMSRLVTSAKARRDGTGGEADGYKQAFEDARIKLLKSPRDEDIREEVSAYMRLAIRVLDKDLESNLNEMLAFVNEWEQVAIQIEQQLGANYFSYIMHYSVADQRGDFALEQNNIGEAKRYFREMLHFADLIKGAPDADEFDAEKKGYNLEAFKMAGWLNIAMLDDEDALTAAKSGLRLAQARGDAGQLRTGEQHYIQRFKDRISELEEE